MEKAQRGSTPSSEDWKEQENQNQCWPLEKFQTQNYGHSLVNIQPCILEEVLCIKANNSFMSMKWSKNVS